MEQRDRITLVCTSSGRNPDLLQKMLDSAIGFDEIILHIDKLKFEDRNNFGHKAKQIGRIFSDNHLTIPEAYNFMIENVKTQWVCCMCDDDYFYQEGLSKMIAEVHNGIIAGVAHFKFHISGYIPPQDIRGRFLSLIGKKEYDLCEKQFITPELFLKHGRIPAASFFRKRAWELAGGFQGEFEHDRNLWLRMAQVGIEFKYFDHLVYNFVRRKNSAWANQLNSQSKNS